MGFYWKLSVPVRCVLVVAVIALGACSEFAETSGTAGDVIAPDQAATDAALEVLSDQGSDAVVTPPDVSSEGIWQPDAAIPPGAFGSPCDDNADCNSGLCVPGPDGDICTRTCVEECPAGFSCKSISTGADSQFVCIYDHVPYCRPCTADSDCAHPQFTGQGNVCIDSGTGQGSFCATPCDSGPCPAGAVCESVDTAQGSVSMCRPVGGTECSCSAWAIEVGASTACSASNALGACEGVRVCSSEGLSACDAPEPVEELCNDIDDDCDGATDETFAAKGEVCDGDDSDLCDDGAWVCSADGTLTCDDDEASSIEVCNDLDDDCDGETDEDFSDKGSPCDGNDVDLCPDGVYVCTTTGLTCDDDEASNVELCNDIDDDCNGQTDETFVDKGQACDGPDDDACAFGVWACDASGGLECADDSAEATFTDLDGTGGLAPGDGCGVGACAGGTVVCESGSDVTCSSWNLATEEVCDGIDNDCDGLTDETFAPGGTVTWDDGGRFF